MSVDLELQELLGLTKVAKGEKKDKKDEVAYDDRKPKKEEGQGDEDVEYLVNLGSEGECKCSMEKQAIPISAIQKLQKALNTSVRGSSTLANTADLLGTGVKAVNKAPSFNPKDVRGVIDRSALETVRRGVTPPAPAAGNRAARRAAAPKVRVSAEEAAAKATVPPARRGVKVTGEYVADSAATPRPRVSLGQRILRAPRAAVREMGKHPVLTTMGLMPLADETSGDLNKWSDRQVAEAEAATRGLANEGKQQQQQPDWLSSLYSQYIKPNMPEGTEEWYNQNLKPFLPESMAGKLALGGGLALSPWLIKALLGGDDEEERRGPREYYSRRGW